MAAVKKVVKRVRRVEASERGIDVVDAMSFRDTQWEQEQVVVG